MTLRIVDRASVLEARRAFTGEISLPYSINGAEKYLTVRVQQGRYPAIRFTRPVGELLTTPAGLEAFIQKFVVDLESGRDAVPLVYQPIYREVEDANLPQFVAVRSAGGLRTVFLEHLEGEELKMGAREFGEEDVIPIRTWATLWQRTEEVSLYDQTWTEAEQSRATGEAYNAMLNHVHLGPIVTYTYPPANQSGPVVPAGDQWYAIAVRQTLINAMRAFMLTRDPLTQRYHRPSLLLAHPSRRFDLEDAFQRMVWNGSEYPAFSGLDTIVYYDGWSNLVGGKAYQYPGVDPSKCYLIEPQTYARSFIKHRLRTDADNADLSRLLEMQVAARARLGVYIAPEACVMEVTLPDPPAATTLSGPASAAGPAAPSAGGSGTTAAAA